MSNNNIKKLSKVEIMFDDKIHKFTQKPAIYFFLQSFIIYEKVST